MFERYTEKARRSIFFARYEASNFGSPFIETEHLLLGLLRESQALTTRLFGSRAGVESIRKQVEQHTPVREKIQTSVDLPLSNECKRALAYAAEEAQQLRHDYIGTEHLVLGLLREDRSFAAKILAEYSVELGTLRKELRDTMPQSLPKPGPPSQHSKVTTTLGRFEIALKVANLSVSLAFYLKLGFILVEGNTKDGLLVVQNGVCRIALYQGRLAENLLNFHSGDVSSIAERLQATGVEFTKPPFTNATGETTALLHDPDGNAIYLGSYPGKD